MSKLSPSERFHSLDFLRAAAMYLGVVLHVTVLFGSPDRILWNFYSEYYPDPLNYHITWGVHLFRMQFFYIIAGFFAEMVYLKKGSRYFSRNRLKRILVPFIFGCLIIHPLTMGVFAVHNAELADLSFLQRSLHFFLWEFFSGTDYNPGIDFAHFWFMWFLMIFYFIHLLGRAVFLGWFQKLKLTRGWIGFVDVCIQKKYGVFILAGMTLMFHLTLRSSIFLPSEAHLDAALSDLSYYMVFYFFGVALFHCKDFFVKLTQHLSSYLLIIVLFMFWIHAATDTIDLHRSPVVDINSWKPQSFQVFWEGVFYGGPGRYLTNYVRCLLCWCFCFALFGLGQKYFSRKNEMVRYFADASYWVYWVHLPITFYFSVLLQPVELNSFFKAYLAVVVSTIVIISIYMVCVRNTILADFFCGWRKPFKEDPLLNYLTLNWKSLVLKTGTIGVVALVVGQIMHTTIVKKNHALLVESFILRNESFLKNAENVNITDAYGQNALFSAVQRAPSIMRKYDAVALLIEKGIDVNHRDNFTRTPLYMACRSGVFEDIEKLLNAGADPNVQDASYGHAPLHVVAIKLGGKYLDGWTTGMDGSKAIENYKAIFELLVNNGASLDLKDKKGRNVAALLKRFTPFKLAELTPPTPQ
ncbi:MAG: acyltransferase family protein [Verrucomicrobiota bacterium]|nr:acyltransferase family protein [Verrucomicrobiota bacterium]